MNFSTSIVTLILAPVLVVSIPAFSQTTLIPDPNFEQSLIDMGLDTTLDGHVLTSNISTVASINVDNKGISDLTGIEAFGSLTQLSCKQNLLTAIDVSLNSVLINFDCRQNQLASLDISQNPHLQSLRCTDNSITDLDLSQNPALQYLFCQNNPLNSLDVTQNPDLYWFHCDNTGLTVLDITQNPVLTILHCNYNQLTSLDLGQNPDLLTLECQHNLLESIIPGTTSAMSLLTCNNNQLFALETAGFPLLEGLTCDSNSIGSLELNSNCLQSISCVANQLTSLDLSQSTTLGFVNCSSNVDLIYLDVSNTTPSGPTTLIATDNPDLTCIITNDSTFDHSTNWSYDALLTQLVQTMAACNLNVGIAGSTQVSRPCIYPNPVVNELRIASRSDLVWDEVGIYTMQGQRIGRFGVREVMDASQLKGGMYVITLYADGLPIRSQTFLKE